MRPSDPDPDYSQPSAKLFIKLDPQDKHRSEITDEDGKRLAVRSIRFDYHPSQPDDLCAVITLAPNAYYLGLITEDVAGEGSPIASHETIVARAINIPLDEMIDRHGSGYTFVILRLAQLNILPAVSIYAPSGKMYGVRHFALLSNQKEMDIELELWLCFDSYEITNIKQESPVYAASL